MTPETLWLSSTLASLRRFITIPPFILRECRTDCPKTLPTTFTMCLLVRTKPSAILIASQAPSTDVLNPAPITKKLATPENLATTNILLIRNLVLSRLTLPFKTMRCLPWLTNILIEAKPTKWANLVPKCSRRKLLS